MSWWSNMSRRDRQMLTVTGVLGALLIAVIAVVGPTQDQGGVPSTFSNGVHGARAAYLLLKDSGYNVVRSVDPLTKVAGTAAPQMTFVFADPFFDQVDDARQSVKEILQRGGRVVVTGFTGALLLPGKRKDPVGLTYNRPCISSPSGLSAVAGSGEIHIAEEAVWEAETPNQQVAYRCGKDPVVITFPLEKGTVVWWASSSPLENATIRDGGNLALLLNSLGPRATTHVIWDESLHGATPSLWSYTAGTVFPYLGWQFALAALLLLFSFSRRSGPLRPDPVVRRAAPLEFVRSLGGLYEKADATNVAVTVAYQDFRLRLERTTGIGTRMPVQEAADALQRRYPAFTGIEQMMESAEQAEGGTPLTRKAALTLVQALQKTESKLS